MCGNYANAFSVSHQYYRQETLRQLSEGTFKKGERLLAFVSNLSKMMLESSWWQRCCGCTRLAVPSETTQPQMVSAALQ